MQLGGVKSKTFFLLKNIRYDIKLGLLDFQV